MDLTTTRGQGDGQEVPPPGGGVGAQGGAGGPEGQPAAAIAAPSPWDAPESVDVTVPPAKDFVEALIGMGIARSDAELGVRQTGGSSVEAAISWVFENRESSSRDRLEQEGIYQEYKMVFCVNASLGMSPGKMAAQVGHGVIDLYQNLVSDQEEYGGPVLQWIENGSKKVVLRCDNDAHLTALAKKCEEMGLPHSIISDAGLTEVPSGSQTVLSIFGVSSNVDKVSGKLSLL